MYDVIQVSLTTTEVLSVLGKDLAEWKAKAVRNNALMRGVGVSELLLVVESGKYKVGDTYNNAE